MKKIIIAVVVSFGIMLLGKSIFAEERPVDVALIAPIQLFTYEDVKGVRLNFIYGRNNNVTGVDLGLINYTLGDWKGFVLGGINKVGGDALGLQLGVVNYIEGEFKGWQDGFVNITRGESTGLQTGLYNQAGIFHGLQFGFINKVNVLDGLQIGLLNFHQDADQKKFPKESVFFPIVNWSI